MAIGYPDFYSFQIINSYEVVNVSYGAQNNMVNLTNYDIYDIADNGKIKDLYIRFHGCEDGDIYSINLKLDDKLYDAQTVFIGDPMIIEPAYDNILKLVDVKADNTEFIIFCNSELIFFESIVVGVSVVDGNSPDCNAILHYLTQNPTIIYAPI